MIGKDYEEKRKAWLKFSEETNATGSTDESAKVEPVKAESAKVEESLF
jgi:hypothetical protein